MPGEVTKYTDLPQDLVAFLKNLSEAVKNDPTLRLDLSDPVHAGMLRMVDVKKADGTEIGPEEEFDLSVTKKDENSQRLKSPYSATEYYACAQDSTVDFAHTPTAKQSPFKVEEDGSVTTALTEDEMTRIYTMAKKGLLCVVSPGSQVSMADGIPWYAIRADEKGELTMTLSTDITKKLKEEEMTREQKMLFEGVTLVDDHNTEAFHKALASNNEEKIAAEQSILTYSSMYWASKVNNQHVLSQGEIQNVMLMDNSWGAYFVQIRPKSVEDYEKFMVMKDGKPEPLFDVKELEKMRDGTNRMELYAKSRIFDAMENGGVFRLHEDGKDKAERLYLTKDPKTGNKIPHAETLDGYTRRRSVSFLVKFCRLFKKDAFQADVDAVDRHNALVDNRASIDAVYAGYEDKKARESLTAKGYMNEKGDLTHCPMIPQKQGKYVYIAECTDPKLVIENEKKVIMAKNDLRERLMNSLTQKHSREFITMSKEEKDIVVQNIDKLSDNYAREKVNIDEWLKNGDKNDGMKYTPDRTAAYLAGAYAYNRYETFKGDFLEQLKDPKFAEKLPEVIKCSKEFNDLLPPENDTSGALKKDSVQKLRNGASSVIHGFRKESKLAEYRFDHLQKDGKIMMADIRKQLADEKAKLDEMKIDNEPDKPTVSEKTLTNAKNEKKLGNEPRTLGGSFV